MPYLRIHPSYLQRYTRGDSIYVGPTTPVNYRVMSTVVDPDTGEIKLTGMREQQGEFPVFPGMFFSWIVMGIVNFLLGKLFSLFGFKANPLELRFHYGLMERQDYLPNNRGNGNGKYGSGRNSRSYGQGWENGLAKELYRFD
jgi:hypothetical protein